MPRWILLCLGAGLGAGLPAGGAPGQTARADSGPDTLRAFRTPASPAFVLLGVSPTAVERPRTPQTLVVSLVSGVQDEDFPPKRYALEVAPYWLTRHRTLTFERYAAPGFWQSLVQTLSISVATSDLSAPDSGTALGFGLRAAYVSSRDLSAVRALRDTLRQIQMGILRAETEPEERRHMERARPVALRLQRALRTERLGWTIEGAAAALMDFPGDVAENGKLARVGVWLTSGYRLAKPAADLLTVVRIVRDERAVPAEDLLDLGGRFVMEREDLALSAEYVHRSVSSSGTSRRTYRVSASAEYRLSANIYVTASLGRDHEESGTGTSRLIAQVALDVGLGPVPLIGARGNQ